MGYAAIGGESAVSTRTECGWSGTASISIRESVDDGGFGCCIDGIYAGSPSDRRRRGEHFGNGNCGNITSNQSLTRYSFDGLLSKRPNGEREDEYKAAKKGCVTVLVLACLKCHSNVNRWETGHEHTIS